MSKKSMLKEAAQREVNAGRLNPDAVKDLIRLAKKRVEVIGEGPTAIYKIGGDDINVGLGRMIDKRPYFQPIKAANDAATTTATTQRRKGQTPLRNSAISEARLIRQLRSTSRG